MVQTRRREKIRVISSDEVERCRQEEERRSELYQVVAWLCGVG